MRNDAMDILNCNELMINGIACQKDVNIEFPLGKCCRKENVTIIFVRRGTANIEVNFIKYELKENMVITIVPNSTVKCTYVSDDFKGSFLTFNKEMGADVMPRPDPCYMDFVGNYPLDMIPEHRVESTHANLENIVYFLYQNEGAHRMQIVKNLAQGLLLEIYDEAKAKFLENKPKEVNRQNELFMEFIHLVHTYGDKNREVAFYADKLCITTRYLASIVRNIANETSKDIIDRHCVQEIKNLLITTNQSIQSIAIELEFPNQSFFTRYFKNLTGMTPKDFRETEG